MTAWNWLDWILVLIFVLSVLLAIRKGFVRELISLAAVVAGVIIASLEYWRGAGWFGRLTSSRDAAFAAGFAVIFIAVLLAGALISAVARFLVRKAGIEGVDRLLGALFGAIRGFLIDCVVVMALMAFSIRPVAVQSSRLAPYVSAGSRAIASVMPRNLYDRFHLGFERFRQAVLQASRSAADQSGARQ